MTIKIINIKKKNLSKNRKLTGTSFIFKSRTFGKVGTLSGQTIFRSINTLYILSGKGKNKKPVAVARFI